MSDRPRDSRARRSAGTSPLFAILAFAICVIVGFTAFALLRSRPTSPPRLSPAIAELPRSAATAPLAATPAPSSVSTGDSGYALTARETAILRLFLQKDFLAFARGEPSLAASPALGPASWAGDPPIRTTAEQLQSDVDDRGTVADASTLGHTLLLSGRVAAIDSATPEGPQLRLEGGRRPDARLRARMAPAYVDVLSTVDKGHAIELACQGADSVSGAATLVECRPLETWVSEATDHYLGTAGSKIVSGDRGVLMLVITAMTVEHDLRDDSECFRVTNPTRACDAEIQEVMARSQDPSRFKPAADKLHVDLATLLLESKSDANEPNAAPAP